MLESSRSKRVPLRRLAVARVARGLLCEPTPCCVHFARLHGTALVGSFRGVAWPSYEEQMRVLRSSLFAAAGFAPCFALHEIDPQNYTQQQQNGFRLDICSSHPANRSLVQQRFALLWGRGACGVYNCKSKKKAKMCDLRCSIKN